MTCYCGKPYAARPMIECSKCLTWLHFSCAKIRRKHIPEIFICIKCNANGGEVDRDVNANPPNNINLSQSNSEPGTILQPLNVNAPFASTKTTSRAADSTTGDDDSVSTKNKNHLEKHRSTRKSILNRTV